ncbi:GerMN domain-containing protein [Alkalicoccus luteus]|uniref:GerMN domain-containing protein n=1 Tax=Alkalicoccus luteus TaxID=1237094 RepID=A0A969PVK4_9BACI|nr:GerMN domain-containing protein [Alkalicoccus luteus]NJP38718.1 GerMN domain-containing protein [Alkalicoccus luteus]
MRKMRTFVIGAMALSLAAACGVNEADNNENEADNNVGGANEVEENLDELNENTEGVSNQEENANASNEADDENNAEEDVAEPDSENNENNEEANTGDENESSEEEAEAENSASNDDEANEEAADETEAVISPLYLYFSDAELLNNYRVEADNEVSMDEAGAMEAMELWAAGPTHEELYPLLPEGTTVQSVALDDTSAEVSFSPEIEDANLGSSGEMMLLEQIAMMMQQFGAEETSILVDGESAGALLGHTDLDEAVQAGSPEDFQSME